MKLTGSAFCNKADLSTIGTTVLGRIVGCQYLHFLNAVCVEHAQGGCSRSCTHGVNTVNGDGIVRALCPIDSETVGTQAVRIELVEVAADNTGLHQRQVQGIAAVQRKIIDLLGFDCSSYERCVSLDLSSGTLDHNRL
jgi:hypothetical protein